MISKEISEALNEQIVWEMYSANLYLSMSAYLHDQGLTGFSHWMRVQYQEETAHALKIYDFLITRGGKVVIKDIAAPPTSWNSVLELFEATLTHEQGVTRRINDLMHLAKDQRDFATDIFLQWFVSEQVEEEDNVTDMIHRLRLIDGKGQGLLILDQELGGRTFTGESD
jgi:ferritin